MHNIKFILAILSALLNSVKYIHFVQLISRTFAFLPIEILYLLNNYTPVLPPQPQSMATTIFLSVSEFDYCLGFSHKWGLTVSKAAMNMSIPKVQLLNPIAILSYYSEKELYCFL